MPKRVTTSLLLCLFAFGGVADETTPAATAESSAVASPVAVVVDSAEKKVEAPMSPEDVALEEKLRAAIEAAPDSAQPYATLGGFLVGRNRNGEAVESYQQAIMRDPENPAFFLSIAIAYLHDGHHERAGLMTKQALQLDPNLANARKLLEYISAKEESMATSESH